MKIEINDYNDVTCNGSHCEFLHLYGECAQCGDCPLVQILEQAVDLMFYDAL